MKFTLSWLKEHLETDASLEDILDKLTIIGLEVEEVVNPAETFKDFVVGEVIDAKPHPDADKLKVCSVNIGAKEPVQVVCGAPNARTGLKGVFAAPGTYVPGIDVTLGKAKIRGVESQGMLCSERELELSDEHSGIIELEDGVQAGQSFVDVMQLDDPVIEIAITPNRPDCLGVRGIARDLAAAGLGTLIKDPVKKNKGKGACAVPIDLKFTKANQSACPVFAGATITGVKNGPSPEWMQKRLRAIGLRPINMLVDVTNFFTYDRGRPLHVYDADKISGTIHARMGKKGESLEALDGREYDADEEMCVIADDKSVLGLGGIIGGVSSGSQEDTVNVLVESAYFDPILTAMTGRRLNLNSDARFRFERGVDPHSVEHGIDMAVEMIVKYCGGTASETYVAGTVPDKKTVIKFDTDEVERLTGHKVKDSAIKTYLRRLGFEIDGKGEKIKVTAPSWRPDIGGAADLVEEVIRLVGVDKVASTPLEGKDGVAKPVLTQGQIRTRLARRVLAGRGMVEAINWSFITKEHAKHFGGGQDELELANPISSEMSHMRPSLLPGLISAAKRNRDRGFSDCALFEVGQAYDGDEADQQRMIAAGIRIGTAHLTGSGRDWREATAEVDLYEARADALSVLAAFGISSDNVQVSRDVPHWYHPGRAGLLRMGPKIILGAFGEIHPATQKLFDIEGASVGFEIYLDALPASKRKTRTKQALDLVELQSVRRDLAFILDEAVPAADVQRAARGTDKKLISDVRVFDLFAGANIGEGKKSLAIEVTLQPRQKTLTDEEIEAVIAKVTAAVIKATGGEMRS